MRSVQEYGRLIKHYELLPSTDFAEMRARWSGDLDKHFPPGFADANLTVIQVEVDRIEVHVRGLTPEPFGAGRTLLERQSDGSWRFIPAW